MWDTYFYIVLYLISLYKMDRMYIINNLSKYNIIDNKYYITNMYLYAACTFGQFYYIHYILECFALICSFYLLGESGWRTVAVPGDKSSQLIAESRH